MSEQRLIDWTNQIPQHMLDNATPILTLLIRCRSSFIDLGAREEIAQKHSAIYEPDQFPHAIVKRQSPKTTILIFNSGKIIIAGVEKLNELEQTSDMLKRILPETQFCRVLEIDRL